MKKNKLLLITLSFTFFTVLKSMAQAPTPFIVGGDIDKFYPVVFSDLNWNNSRPTVLEIGRSDVHKDSNWRGSLISSFRFHTTRWGNGARFVDADIRQMNNGLLVNVPFVAGYQDATSASGSYDFIIWLKGGGTTYYLKSEAAQNPLVFDGVQNTLPYQEVNGPTHSFKTAVDNYVNSFGKSDEGTIYSHAAGLNYLYGDLGLGTLDTKGFKLAVNGKIRAKEVKVEATNWPDYVFAEGYKVGKLEELESYIKANKHLPDMPSAKEVETNGLELGELVKLQQQKIEELTLHLIEKDKELKTERERINKLEIMFKKLMKN